jgi:hypothetical protein
MAYSTGDTANRTDAWLRSFWAAATDTACRKPARGMGPAMYAVTARSRSRRGVGGRAPACRHSPGSRGCPVEVPVNGGAGDAQHRGDLRDGAGPLAVRAGLVVELAGERDLVGGQLGRPPAGAAAGPRGGFESRTLNWL